MLSSYILYNNVVSKYKEGTILGKRKYQVLFIILLLILVFNVSGQAESYDNLSVEEAGEILRTILNDSITEEDLINKLAEHPLVEIMGYVETSNENYTLYYVESGDSLYKIANRFDTTIDELKKINNLTHNYLIIGQKLKIPSEKTYVSYTVKPGDTLYQIARRYDISVKEIKEHNNLKNDYLLIGQQLTIPVNDIDKNYTYEVRAGDTLYKIARKFYTTIAEIKAINNLISDYLFIGQRLHIPVSQPDKGYQKVDVTDYEKELLARAVYSEARGEPFEGQVAIAAVVLNRVLHPLFPDTVEKVIFQPWQFTAVHDGQFWLTPNRAAYNAVELALEGWDPSNGAIYYYNPDTASSKWVFYRTVIVKIGEHYFAV